MTMPFTPTSLVVDKDVPEEEAARQVSEIAPSENKQLSQPETEGSSKHFPAFPSLTYVFKRRAGLLKLKNLLLTALFFLIILLGSALQKNVTAEAIRLYRKDKPVDLIKLQGSVVAGLDEKTKSRLTIYDCYYAEDNEITAYYLLPKEYSVLGMPGAVIYGHFPEKETEILINESLAGTLTGNNNNDQLTGNNGADTLNGKGGADDRARLYREFEAAGVGVSVMKAS